MKPRKRQRKPNYPSAILLFGALLLLCETNSFAEDTEPSITAGTVKSEVTESRVRVGLSTGITALSYAGAAANGFGFGVGLQYALSEKWGLKASFNQAFYLSGFAPLYSAADIRVIYALSGSLISMKENISVGANEVLKSKEYLRGGWRIEAQSDLYFFNSVASVIPFTGLGLAASYEFPSSTRRNLTTGIRMDFVSSSKVSLKPIQLFFGVLF